MWKVPREWVGQTAYIVAGGPSFTKDHAEALRGQHVIAINSAIATIPFAEVLLFCDKRWWTGHYGQNVQWKMCGRNTTKNFKGLIVSNARFMDDDRVKSLGKIKPPRWSRDPSILTSRWSSVTAAINYADLAGASRIVLCGVDGKLAHDGTRHNHGIHYPWALKPESFQRHAEEFQMAAVHLNGRVDVINANPFSWHDVWPRRRLEELLPQSEERAVA